MMCSCEYNDLETEPCSVLYMHVCFGIFRIYVSGCVLSDFQVKFICSVMAVFSVEVAVFFTIIESHHLLVWGYSGGRLL